MKRTALDGISREQFSSTKEIFDNQKVQNYLTRKERHLDRRMMEVKALREHQKTMFQEARAKKKDSRFLNTQMNHSIDLSGQRLNDSSTRMLNNSSSFNAKDRTAVEFNTQNKVIFGSASMDFS